jgi:ureidoacrylate peracid hydrolase
MSKPDAVPVGVAVVRGVIVARPEPFAIDARRTAVIVVDVQNDWGAECGTFAHAGIPISISAVVDRSRRFCAPARGAGLTVIS